MKNLNLTFAIVIIITLFFASCSKEALVELPTETNAIEHFEVTTIIPSQDAQQIELKIEQSEVENRSIEILYSEQIYVNQNGWFGIYIPTASLEEGYHYNAYVTPKGTTETDLYAMAFNPYTSSDQFRTVRKGTEDYGAISTYYKKHDFTSNESRAYFYIYGKKGGYVDLTIEKELIYDNGGGNNNNNNTTGTLLKDDFESYDLRLDAAHWGSFMISYNYATVGEGYNFGYNSNKAMRLQSFYNDFEPTAALLKLGNLQSGQYELSWNTFVGHGGSYSFKAPGGIEITLNENGTAVARLGNANPLNFRYTQGRWCSISMKANLNNGSYELMVDNALIRFTNPYSENKFNEVEFMAGSEVMAKIDNILVKRN